MNRHARHAVRFDMMQYCDRRIFLVFYGCEVAAEFGCLGFEWSANMEERNRLWHARHNFAYGMGNSMVFPMSVGATTAILPGRPTPAR